MKTPDFEHQIGIDTYSSLLPGIEGKIRNRIEDFKVTEVFLFPSTKQHGKFTIAEVTTRNWETHRVVQEIARRLHMSQRRISFAGTKDKRAVTTQLMSFDHVSPKMIQSLSIKDVTFTNIYQSDVPVRIGQLLGNRFEITIRNIAQEINTEHITSLLAPFQTGGGFPNFYGVQRFGIIRPITHIVGKYIIQGDFEKAAMTYMAHPMKGEDTDTYTLREELEQTRNYSKAFHSYPETLNFEKAMLNRLIQDPTDFPGAFIQLPKNLLLMFVNAYESFLFNKILSQRIQQDIPLHQAVEGDIVVPVRKNEITTEYIPVSTTNIGKVNMQISKKKAIITGLLLGYDTPVAKGEMGEIEHHIIESEGIDPRDFIVPELPFLSSSGSRRPILALVPSIEWELHPDEFSPQHQALQLRFQLPKGCYATSFLREIMKSKNPKNY